MSTNKTPKPNRNEQRMARELQRLTGWSYQTAIGNLRGMSVTWTMITKRLRQASTDAAGMILMLQFEERWHEAFDAFEEGGLVSLVIWWSRQEEPGKMLIDSIHSFVGYPKDCILKVYFTGDDAGQTEMNFEDFIEDIQDSSVALLCAEDLLQDGESRNDDSHEDIHERYTVTDRGLLVAQIKEYLLDNPDASFDDTLFEVDDVLTSIIDQVAGPQVIEKLKAQEARYAASRNAPPDNSVRYG